MFKLKKPIIDQYIVVSYSEFNNLGYYIYYSYLYPDIIICCPKKVSCLFAYAKKVIILKDSFFDQKNTNTTTSKDGDIMNVFLQEIKKCMAQQKLYPNQIVSAYAHQMLMVHDPSSDFYKQMFDSQAVMLQDKNFKFIGEKKESQNYVVISGRNLNKNNGTNNYNETFEDLIPFLIEQRIKVINITTNQPDFKFDSEYYQEISCDDDYQKQADLFTNSKLNIILGVASSPNIHLMCKGNFLVMFTSDEGWFIEHNNFTLENRSIIKSRKIHPEYITETMVFKDQNDVTYKKNIYDYEQILRLIN